MQSINNLFFELIQVAIGTRICLSHTPSADEWGELYSMAKKQSLVGVCFAGVQKLVDSEKEVYCGMPEMLYLTWMGMAAKIQHRNEVVNRQCVELQEKLSTDGLRYSILKGQGVGQLYAEHLRGLRQSGDIDVFVQGGIKKVLGYCTEKFGKVEWDYINAHAPFYDNTEVEMHWRVQALTNLRLNRKLQEWFKSSKVQGSIFGGSANLANGSRLVVPTAEFNAFYILLHCYHHMFESGLGQRQLMDWYFVLKSRNNTSTDSAQDTNFNSNVNLVALFEQFGMKKFAEGVLWLIWHVFEGENPDSFLVNNSSFLTPNPKKLGSSWRR